MWWNRPEGFVTKSFDTFAPTEEPLIPEAVIEERFSAVIETEGAFYGLGADGWDAAVAYKETIASREDDSHHEETWA